MSDPQQEYTAALAAYDDVTARLNDARRNLVVHKAIELFRLSMASIRNAEAEGEDASNSDHKRKGKKLPEHKK